MKPVGFVGPMVQNSEAGATPDGGCVTQACREWLTTRARKFLLMALVLLERLNVTLDFEGETYVTIYDHIRDTNIRVSDNDNNTRYRRHGSCQ